MAPEAKLLAKPSWPAPSAGHLRGIGGVRQRFLPGFDSWIGEGSLVTGIPGMRLDLPRHLQLYGRPSVQLIRKACHFDGLVNGRFEFLFALPSEPASVADVADVARALLERPVVVPRMEARARPLGRRGPAAAWLWSHATTARHDPSLVEHVRAGRPFVIAETEVALGKMPPGSPVGVRLSIDRKGRPFELLTIHPGGRKEVGRSSSFRYVSRLVRTYLLRLLQDVEAISQLCDVAGDRLEDDQAQLVFNEYTRHISRARQELGNSPGKALVAYCYAAFGRLYPGSLEKLRVQIVRSNIRPNVKTKLLALIDEAMRATTHEIHIEGDLVMGDKFEDVTATGQGIAIGRGANATVSGSVNQALDPQLITALRDLASKIRDSGQEGADIEAECIEAAAKKAEAGDEKGVIAYLKKAGTWALDLASSVGSQALSAFLKSHLGL